MEWSLCCSSITKTLRPKSVDRFSFFFKILFIEAAILFLIGAVFYGQFTSAKSDVISKTISASELIGDEAAEFAVHHPNPTSREFDNFLRNKYGPAGVFKAFNVVPSSFEVFFTKEAWEGRRLRGIYSERGYGVRDKSGVFSVSVPFLVGLDGIPFGVVTINSSKGLIMKKVLKDHLLLYLALFVVLNNQVFILHYFATRKQKNIIDRHYARPYLKVHSIGALKAERTNLRILRKIKRNPAQRR